MKNEYHPANDVEVALMFFEGIAMGITIVVEYSGHIPFVKRAIFKVLGEPNKMYADTLWYEGKPIRIISGLAPSRTRGLHRETTFYVETWE